MANYMTKFGRWFPFLAGCIMLGCAGGPHQSNGAWPWEYGKEFGNRQTGDYIAVSGPVAHFGEPPKATKSITAETGIPGSSSPSVPPETKKTSALLPANSARGINTSVNKAKRDYDFTVGSVTIAPPSYLPMNAVRTTYDLTAFNHGNAPVSVSIAIDQKASQNLATDTTLPLNAVVPPNSDQVMVHLAPKLKNEAYNFSYSYSWSMGDYTARHNCPEQYRFPFGDDIRAFASVNDSATATPYTRYAVVFSLPAGTPIRAARKGKVIQIKSDDRIDILHDDTTIASYSHLGTIAQGITVGKTVSTDDIIGSVTAAGNQKEAYMQLAVWRPEPAPSNALQHETAPGSGFGPVSFPLEFCSENFSECGVLTKSQTVSRNKMTETKKQAKRKVKPAP